MKRPLELEDIQGLRRVVGVDDADHWAAVRLLRVGDAVRLTFLSKQAPGASATVPIRITRIDGPGYRGTLTAPAAGLAFATLRRGSAVVFTDAHIHSVIPRPAPPKRPVGAKPGRAL